jgi:biopolymer transport protein ExbD
MRKKRTAPATAMTDIAFLLLLFFLILALSTRLTPIPLTPATSEDARANPTGKVIIVGSNGSLFFEDSLITLDRLPSETEVTLLADKDTPFNLIHPVLEALKQNGTTTIHCLVGQSQ